MFKLQQSTCLLHIHAKELDPIALEQIQQIIHHPALHGLVAIMPDAHAGAGCVIGFTGKFRNAVIPNIVGVDIGCGVTAHPLPKVDTDMFPDMDAFIRQNIPLGMSQRDNAGFWDQVNLPESLKRTCLSLCQHVEDGFYKENRIGKHLPPVMQLGTLGGGNHFIEICQAEDGDALLVVHSGSRNMGKRIAEFYQNLAVDITKQMGISVPKGMEYLPMSAGGDRYMHWATVAQAYARYNRRIMLAIILSFFNITFDEKQIIESVHNTISEKDNIIRKGAISAHRGEPVIIPLNMADGIIIGTGLGNTSYNLSAPHGAGRKYGRKEMFRKLDRGEFSLTEFSQSMQHVFTTSISRDTFDESKFAYKPASDIETYLLETVAIARRLIPIYNLKTSGD